MKVRNGFVSNSSSSSFICEVCNGTESGWDACMSEVEMFECANGHTLHESCSPNFETPTEDDDSYDEDWRYSHEITQCPICSMHNVPYGIQARYLLAKVGMTSDTLGAELREKFESYDALMKWIKENENP